MANYENNPSKRTSLTQRNEEKFNYQTARRLQEMHLLEIAMAEMQGMCMWFPGQCSAKLSANEENPDTVSTGGAKFMIYFDEDKRQNDARLVAKTTEDRPINLETDLINFVAELQAKVRDYLQVPDLLLATTHKRNGTIFRGHPRFRADVGNASRPTNRRPLGIV